MHVEQKTLKRNKIIVFVSLALFFVGITTLLIFVEPERIVEVIGVKNGYLIVSILAFLGGFSTLTSVSLYASVVTFTLGGLNPIYLGLSALPGLFIGDTLYYYFGNVWNELVSDRTKRLTDRITKFVFRPKIYKVSPLLIYIYVGLTPLPPELLVVALSFSKYPYKKLIVPLALGEFTFVLIIAFLALQGIKIFG